MKHHLSEVQTTLLKSGKKNSMQTVTLAPGMELSYYTMYKENIVFHHQPLSHVMEICADSELSLPNKYYEGLTICIDLDLLTKEPPALLNDTGITGELFLEKYCQKDSFSSFAGNEETNSIFEGFYDQPKNLIASY